jgi:hypothetical protein
LVLRHGWGRVATKRCQVTALCRTQVPSGVRHATGGTAAQKKNHGVKR